MSANESIGTFQVGPAFHEDPPGYETFNDFDLWIGLSGRAQVHLGSHVIDFDVGTVVLATPAVKIRLQACDKSPFEMVYAHFDCYVRGRRIANTRKTVDLKRLTVSLPGLPAISLIGKLDAPAYAARLLAGRGSLSNDVALFSLNIALLEIIMRLRQTNADPRGAEILENSSF